MSPRVCIFTKLLPLIMVKLTAACLLDETFTALTCIQATIGSEIVPSSMNIVLLDNFTCGRGSVKVMRNWKINF